MKVKLTLSFILFLLAINPVQAIINFKTYPKAMAITVQKDKKPLSKWVMEKRKMNIFLKFSLACAGATVLCLILNKLISTVGWFPPFLIAAALLTLFSLSAFVFWLIDKTVSKKR